MRCVNKSIYLEYCTGCGLCRSVLNTTFVRDEKGFSKPIAQELDEKFCNKVCPAGGSASKKNCGLWGKFVELKVGWSNNEIIRYGASSGGVLTAICCYLIDNKLVDGVIQTIVSEQIPYATRTVISRTSEEVLQCKGSRYSMSSPLSEIKQMVMPDEKYAFIGKPCDVSALRLYLEQDVKFANHFEYLFSFFCAGVPSEDAQIKLMSRLECDKLHECESIQYRGNGWPGFATLVKKDGSVSQITYDESWGKILGRDVRKCCRICFDGIGEQADITCGDAWYLNSDKTPDFREAQGRNIIFGRTQKGAELIGQAEHSGYIHIEGDYEIDNLRYIQKYQFERKASMKSVLCAMRLLKKEIPNYDKDALNRYAKAIKLQLKFKRFFGTIRRINEGKI